MQPSVHLSKELGVEMVGMAGLFVAEPVPGGHDLLRPSLWLQ